MLTFTTGLVACSQQDERIGYTPVSLAVANDARTDVFEAVDSTTTRLTRAQRTRLAGLLEQPWVAEPALVRLRTDAGARLRSSSSFSVAGADGQRIMLQKSKTRRGAGGGVAWDANGPSAVVVEGTLDADNVFATVHDAGRVVRYEPIGGGMHVRFTSRVRPGAQVEIDRQPPVMIDTTTRDVERDGAQLQTSAAGVAAQTATPRLLTPQSLADNGAPYIKVMFVYTPATLAFYVGSVSALTAAVNAQVDDANAAYASSGIQQTLLVTSIQPVSYVEGTKNVGTINGETFNGTAFSGVRTQRVQQKADVVAVLAKTVFVDSSIRYCGDASNRAITSLAISFVTLDVQCFSFPVYLLAHEVGHLSGASHQANTGGAAIPGAQAWIDPQNAFRTIMSTLDPCGPFSCPVVRYFSTPNLTEPQTGRPLGVVGTANNASTINQRATIMRDLAAPDAPSVSQVNYSSGQRPTFSWPTVAGATIYSAFRCETGPFGSSCNSVPVSYTSVGSSVVFEDVFRTLTGGYPPCAKATRYYARAYDAIDGASAPSFQQPTVCLQ